MKRRNYKPTNLNTVFEVTTIYTVHYFEYDCNYKFKGEFHNFWEILFVDSGSVEVTAGNRTLVLEKGHVVFHEPDEFHSFRALGKNPPNLVVVSFDCDCPRMDIFRQQVLAATDYEIQLFGKLIEIAKGCFALPLASPLRLRYDAPFGSEQLFKNTLELLLIHFYRQLQEKEETPVALPTARAKDSHLRLMDQVVHYLEERVYQSLNVETICRENMVGKSLLQRIFHEQKGCGVIEYFNRMKIDTAKRLIRENRYTYSQIAAMLNYSSYQYFSLQFKKYARMSPSEYHSSSQYFH